MKRKKTLVSLLNEIVSLKEEDFDLDAGPDVPGTLGSAGGCRGVGSDCRPSRSARRNEREDQEPNWYAKPTLGRLCRVDNRILLVMVDDRLQKEGADLFNLFNKYVWRSPMKSLTKITPSSPTDVSAKLMSNSSTSATPSALLVPPSG